MGYTGNEAVQGDAESGSLALLVGSTSGRLVVIDTELGHENGLLVHVRCDACGKELWVSRSKFIRGKIRSCGCQWGQHWPTPFRLPDLPVGRRIGRMVVLASEQVKRKTRVFCEACQMEGYVDTNRLRRTTSAKSTCGCTRYERTAAALPIGFRSQGSQLVVVSEELVRSSSGAVFAHVHCDACGKESRIATQHVRSGQKTCGCKRFHAVGGRARGRSQALVGQALGTYRCLEQVGAMLLLECSACMRRIRQTSTWFRARPDCGRCSAKARASERIREVISRGTYGDWRVLSAVGEDGRTFLCQCACGKKHVQKYQTLVDGRSVSCKRCSHDRRIKKYTVLGHPTTALDLAKTWNIPLQAFYRRLAGGWSPEEAAMFPHRPKGRKRK